MLPLQVKNTASPNTLCGLRAFCKGGFRLCDRVGNETTAVREPLEVVALRTQANACHISCQMAPDRHNFVSIFFEGPLVPELLLWPLAAVDARLDVVDAGHDIGDGVDYVMRTALFHTPVSVLALERLLRGR